jgi:F0F1-type ATP synthase membrane subunit c/vacuolar-type H+-ATPase subunit K
MGAFGETAAGAGVGAGVVGGGALEGQSEAETPGPIFRKTMLSLTVSAEMGAP